MTLIASIVRNTVAGTQKGPMDVTSPRRLKQEWVLGERIGDQAGFGRVYAAASPAYPDAAAKFVRKAPGAERELLLADDLAGVRNVVPVLDSGEAENDWVLVMPRAEQSLLAYLLAAQGPLRLSEAVPILTDVAMTLSDLEGRVVHRDLKPANILRLNGRWCLADFGISRYADATTAPDTRKFFRTHAYAAPEQWRAERASSATDVYAFGVIAYEMLAGARPFTGPAEHDYHHQHLHGAPPPLENVPTMLSALVDECLFKQPGARPTATNVLARLERIPHASSFGSLARLEAVNRAEVTRRGEASRQASVSHSEAERRASLANAAATSLTRISGRLRDSILEAAPTAGLHEEGPNEGWTLRLGLGTLKLAGMSATPTTPWKPNQRPKFEVIAHTSLEVRTPYRNYAGRAHSLWYCDAQDAGRYRWFETAFMNPHPRAPHNELNPCALDPGSGAGFAVGFEIGAGPVAWPFTPVSIDDMEEFINRWAEWLAAAAEGNLYHPHSMPERSPQGSWRT